MAFPGILRSGQAALPLGLDIISMAFQHNSRRHVADRTVNLDVVVILHVTLNHFTGLIQRQRHARPDALDLERLVPSLDLAVGLRIVRTRPHMRHLAERQKGPEVLQNVLRAVVRDDPRPGVGILLTNALEYDLDVPIGHRFADFPVYDQPRTAVEKPA